MNCITAVFNEIIIKEGNNYIFKDYSTFLGYPESEIIMLIKVCSKNNFFLLGKHRVFSFQNQVTVIHGFLVCIKDGGKLF